MSREAYPLKGTEREIINTAHIEKGWVSGQLVKGGLLRWHVMGAQKLAAIQEHICVLFSRHPCGELKDRKQKPHGTHGED